MGLRQRATWLLTALSSCSGERDQTTGFSLLLQWFDIHVGTDERVTAGTVSNLSLQLDNRLIAADTLLWSIVPVSSGFQLFWKKN